MLLALFGVASALGAAHADDHRLHATDGCAVCRHVRATPVVLEDAVTLSPLWLRWSAPATPASATCPACAQSARARSPPVV